MIDKTARVASIQQVGDEEVEAINGRDREQRFLMASVAMSLCSTEKQQTLISRRIRYVIANVKSWPHWLPAVQHLVLTRVNIIMWVCYFSHGCATAVYASATLSLSLYYS